jgi:hypothetical protein
MNDKTKYDLQGISSKNNRTPIENMLQAGVKNSSIANRGHRYQPARYLFSCPFC